MEQVEIRKLKKRFAPKYQWAYGNLPASSYRRDKVALRNTYIKNIKFKIIKVKTGCQYVGYLHNSENLNWAACGPRVRHGADLLQQLRDNYCHFILREVSQSIILLTRAGRVFSAHSSVSLGIFAWASRHTLKSNWVLLHLQEFVYLQRDAPDIWAQFCPDGKAACSVYSVQWQKRMGMVPFQLKTRWRQALPRTHLMHR